MVISLKNIKYKDILDIESLTLDANSIAILGKSGSGKSTLLRILCNLATADSGSYIIDGKNVQDYDAVSLRRDITLLGQKPIIYNGTVKENLIIGLSFQAKEVPDDIVLTNFLQKFQLKCNLDDNASVLSLGEMQRICMIRVLLLKSKVYLLDEPTSSLDKQTEIVALEIFFQIVKEIHSQVIFVTHNESLSSYAQRVITIEEGKAYEHN